jgi:hypothetical protein
MKDNLILPSDKIIGSTKKEPIIPVNQKNYEAEKKYNAEINNHPEIISKLKIRDNYVMLRMFKYDHDPVSEGGILVKDMQEVMTEGGRKKAEFAKNPYQMRAVIVLISDSLKDDRGIAGSLKIGDVVHIAPGNYKGFNTDKTVEVPADNGYFLVHASAIDCIELQ